MLAETQPGAWEIRRRHSNRRAVLEDSWEKAEARPEPYDHWEDHAILKFRPRAEEAEVVSDQYLRNLQAARLIAQWEEEEDEIRESEWLEFEAMLERERHG